MYDWEAFVRRHLSLAELRPEREKRIVRELASQLEDLYRDAVSRGNGEEEAKAFAELQIQDWECFGCEIRRADRSNFQPRLDRWANNAQDEAQRRGGAWQMLSDLFRDAAHVLRVFRKQPGFTAVALLTIAIGIGANTAIFSVVQAVLLQPIPYPPSPHEVLVLTENNKNWHEISVSYPDFKDWQAEGRSFESMAGYRDGRYNLTGLDEPLRLRVRLVSYGYFGIMGVGPLHGRFFSQDEDQPGAPGRTVINHSLWQKRFGGDPAVIGRAMQLNNRSFTIIGILPPDFEIMPRERAYIPLEPWADNESTRHRGNHEGIRVLARMKDDVSIEKARAEMEAVASRLESQYPDTNSGVGVNVETINNHRVEDYQSTLLLLLGAVSLVLLVACTNVGSSPSTSPSSSSARARLPTTPGHSGSRASIW